MGYSTRIPTTGGVRELRRFGFATKTEADKAAAQVWDLIRLAGGDKGTQQRIGDLISTPLRAEASFPQSRTSAAASASASIPLSRA
ncbi:MAG TPA: hypothetical protein VGS06_14615 [Streptosporangiaceae bacterium]|nr:hypothetical protein [Streptosporangiaceae bacterium]